MLRVQEEDEKPRPIQEVKQVLVEELDPWMLYLYAIKSPATKEKYLMRLRRFLDFVNLQEVNNKSKLEDKARIFAKRGRGDSTWAFNNIIRFIQLQKDRFNRKEITAGTIPILDLN